MNQDLFFILGYAVRPDDLWVVATAAVCSAACALVGSFLVLRRLSLLGDSISHAILPGIAGAFMLSGSRDPLVMFAGAVVIAIVTALLTGFLQRAGKVADDAATGVVFTILFAIGVIMITFAARDVDLDPGCVLYGLIEFTPFDMRTVLGVEIPRALLILTPVLLTLIVLITLFYKELQVTSFDPALAATMGISASLVHHALTAATAATAVASFESVGSILVVAMLAAPGASAHLLTDRLGRLLWISVALAVLASILGYVVAVWLNTSVAGAIAAAAGAQFVFIALVAPRHGYLAKLARRALLSARIVREDLLGLLYRWHEQAELARAQSLAEPRPLSVPEARRAIGSGPLARLAVLTLRRAALVRTRTDGSLVLTTAGLDAARPIVRGHRLWERFLADHLGLPLDHLHDPSHRVEHFLTPRLRDELAAPNAPITAPAPRADAEPDRDPHGSPIPRG